MNRTRSGSKWFSSRTDVFILAASVLGPLVLYVLTMPRTVALEDDGLFLMAGAHLGVAHPPGYPVHNLIVYLFTQLPFGSSAFLGHLSSAVLGAFACGCVYLCARLLGVYSVPSLASSWLFGASEHFWSQAIITEVYTLNAMFFFGLYGLVLYGVRRPHRTWIWFAVVVGYGLSLANHWPLTILSTPGLVFLAIPVRQFLYRKIHGLLGAFVLAVTVPYAWMVWRSNQSTPISFYGPIDSIRELWFYVSRRGYAGADTSPSAGWSDRLEYMQWLGNELVWQLTFPGFMLAVIGLVVLLHRRRIYPAISGLLVLLGNSIVLIALIRYDFDYFRIAIFRPYSLACYGIFALWLGIGLHFVLDRLAAQFSMSSRQRSLLIAGLSTVLLTALVGWSVHRNLEPNDRSDSVLAEQYAKTVLDFLPENAALFVSGDNVLPLGYFKYVEHFRPDVDIYALDGLIYSNRLYNPFVEVATRKGVLQRYIDSNERRLFVIGDTSLFPIPCVRYYGFICEAIREVERGTIELYPHDGGQEFFKYLIHSEPVDRWERHLGNLWLFEYGRYLGIVTYSENPLYLESMDELLKVAEEHYPCLIGMVTALHRYGNESHWDQISDWLSKAEYRKDEATSKPMLAWLYNLNGDFLQKQGDTTGALRSYRMSRNIYPHPKNKAVKFLEQNERSIEE